MKDHRARISLTGLPGASKQSRFVLPRRLYARSFPRSHAPARFYGTMRAVQHSIDTLKDIQLPTIQGPFISNPYRLWKRGRRMFQVSLKKGALERLSADVRHRH